MSCYLLRENLLQVAALHLSAAAREKFHHVARRNVIKLRIPQKKGAYFFYLFIKNLINIIYQIDFFPDAPFY